MAVRYGTPQFLLRSTACWYGTRFLLWYGYGTMVRCLNLPTKRFMCNVQPSVKICETVIGVHIV